MDEENAQYSSVSHGKQDGPDIQKPPDELKPSVAVGFLLPVIDEKIYLGQRNTPPHRGVWGPIGGKSESYRAGYSPLTKTALGGGEVPTVLSQIAQASGLEYPHITALREFFEEVYQMSLDLKHVRGVNQLGSITDEYDNKAQYLSFFIAIVDNLGFNLNHRELQAVSPLEDIAIRDMSPNTVLALEAARFWLTQFPYEANDKWQPYLDMRLQDQIPKFSVEDITAALSGRSTTMQGPGLLGAGGEYWIPVD
ncbi:hypothetical protein JW868_00580 [Candidatus Woesearchaeota archaeon]|nr:hypothetical protein [Candidatus Woesearchaeota archaeon]